MRGFVVGPFLPILVVLMGPIRPMAAQRGDWPEPRGNPHLTAIQPLPGKIAAAAPIAQFDLGRSEPALAPVVLPGIAGHAGLAVVAGALYCFDTAGKQLWFLHPPGLNFSKIVAHEDLDGDGKTELLLQAGRPTEPYAAAVLASLEDGRVLWRYDVEPMSYAWYLYNGNYLPGVSSQQIVVIMHAYPPDKDNGYIALFEYPEKGKPPVQKWRYDFHEYTCFPSFLQTDLDGDAVKELVVETHSRMWLLDAVTGKVKQFVKWDVTPANIRSYGLVKFVDLDGDAREDFLCIASFAQHHEVLLNRNGQFGLAWSHGWPESVTTGKVDSLWPEPPHADVDGDGRIEIVVSMYNSLGEGAWLLRVYDAVSGELKYKAPGYVAESVVDLDNDSKLEILANRTSDPTLARLDGACILDVHDKAIRVRWQDANAKAIKPAKDGTPRIERNGTTFIVSMDAEGKVTKQEWSKPKKDRPEFTGIPPIVGATMPQVLVSDLIGDTRNEILLYSEPTARVLIFTANGLEQVASYTSSSLPVIADLDGDGNAEMVLSTAAPGIRPVLEARTPKLGERVLWRTEYPEPNRAGLPHGRAAYLRTVHFTGKPTPDLYALIGTPLLRSTALEGTTGRILWEKGEFEGIERYWAPTVDFASAFDFDQDGKEDLVFTNPDYYCVAASGTGDMLLGPVFPPKIFDQPSQGLYTYPAILKNNDRLPTVCLVDGHYFQAAMSLKAEPYWYKIPVAGENRSAAEGFLQLADGTWLMGFGRQNGNFACVNVADGSLRWELPLEASCSDVTTCDVDGDNRQEFLFGTSHGKLYAVGDGEDKARVVWSADLGATASVGAPIPADVNADGASEIVVPASDGYLYIFGGKS
ncbi:MAG: VCBS repeat-containing protein [Candidatus Hydrogenedentes bacterium]|nr:VCBS repeat-containing protein [Candidatus Hydrogenedentota bacterium]